MSRIEDNANLVLWCVHTLGPDDVLATCTHQAAVDMAGILNKVILDHQKSPKDVMCFSYAAPWPHSAEAHAENLRSVYGETA